MLFKKKSNRKKGAIELILFFSIILLILIIGFIAAVSYTMVDYVSNEITPIFTSIGSAGSAGNISEYAEYGIGTVNTAVNGLGWIIAFGYIMALIFTLVFVYVGRVSQNKAFMGFYFVLMILLIFGSIVMSNIYQDLYSGSDIVGTGLQDQSIMSYMMLHSPLFLVIIAVVGGIIMFTIPSDEGGYY